MVSTWRNVRREIKFISCHGPVPGTTKSFILSHLFCQLPYEVGVSLHSHFICEPQRDASKVLSCTLVTGQDSKQDCTSPKVSLLVSALHTASLNIHMFKVKYKEVIPKEFRKLKSVFESW